MKNNFNWICIYTNTKMENYVSKQINDLGLDVYFPRYKKSISHARKIIDKIYPLFPRYLFVKTLNNELLVKIRGLHGVSDFIKNNRGSPQKLSNEDIKRLKLRENKEGYINYNRFLEGQKIRINKAKIFNLKASFVKKICRDNAEVLIELLGREHKIIAPYSSIDQIH